MNCGVKLDLLLFVLRVLQRDMFLHTGATVKVNPTHGARKPYTLRSSPCWAFDRYDRLEGGHRMLKLFNGNVFCHDVLRLGPTKFQQFLVSAGGAFVEFLSQLNTAKSLPNGFVVLMCQVRRPTGQGT